MRVFWGEVGVIVLGVPLALGAQKVIEAVNWLREVFWIFAFMEIMADNYVRFPPIADILDSDLRAIFSER